MKWSNGVLDPSPDSFTYSDIRVVSSGMIEETEVLGENNQPSERELTNFLTLALSQNFSH